MKTDINLLMKQTAEGNQASFRLLYDRLAPVILAVLMKMLADRHLAEDILQETMMQTWRKAVTFDASKASASTWIITIARNRALDLLRKRGRFVQIVEDSDYQIKQTLHPDHGSIKADLVSATTHSRLNRCLDKLNVDPAACIRLAYVNGFSFGEIASFRDNSINSVKSWVRRGLEKLGECMQ